MLIHFAKGMPQLERLKINLKCNIEMKNRYILLLFTLFFVVTGSVAQDGAVIVSGTVYDKAGE